MPAPKEPRGSHKLFTDEQLRGHLSDGWNAPRIAEHYGCSKQAVYQRIKQLGQTTAAAAVAPEESKRFVKATTDELEVLSECLARVRLVQDACHRWLLDPENEAQYDIGARSNEITVVYEVVVDTERGSRIVKRKAKLNQLLGALQEADGLTFKGEVLRGVAGAESKHADPRSLILDTVLRCESVLKTGLELIDRIRGAQMMEAFREEMLAGIAEVAPEVRCAIEERLRSRLVRWTAATGLGVLPGNAA